jgi:serine/threonine protein phosphatase PrpC
MRALEDYSIMADPIELQKGDALLLCTDGLYKCLDNAQMGRRISGSAQASASALIRAVARKHLKGQDNATALVLKWMGTSGGYA